MKRLLLFSLAAYGFFAATPNFAHAADAALIDQQIESLRQEYGVQVHYRFDPATYFPKSWLAPPRSAKGSQLDLDEVERFIPIISKFLQRNPKAVIQRNLSDIYLSGTLEFFGKPFGGSNSLKAVYVHSAGKSRGFTDDFLQEGLHHEFSSILMRNYQFPTAQWNQINPPDFSYGNSGVEVLGQTALHGQSDELLTQGFLEKYCRSTMENDFNVVSAWLFVTPDKLKPLVEKYPRIAAKTQLAIAFYRSIDPGYQF
jgi:hypothetical protein